MIMKLLKVITWISMICAMVSVVWLANKLNHQPPRVNTPVNALGGR